ncbi:MAG TPA: alpha/beta fold hydrolase [Caulobacteraceae bacterium]
MAQESSVPKAATPMVSGLDGDWAGELQVGGRSLRLALHITTGPDGTKATVDSIDQSAFAMPVSSISRDGAKVRVEIKAIAGVYEGVLAADGASMSGTWTQGGNSLPLNYTRQARGTPQAKLVRPQTPQPPFPYDEQKLSFESPGAHATLAGTLTVPRGPGSYPAVVLIAGSGPNDRDETIFGHKPFWVLADYLSRRGIAVLRYDKRGIGASSGDYAHASSLDFAADAAAAVAWLRGRPEINHAKIGLIGHSEGGIIAPIVADRDPAIAFIVLLAGPGLNGEEILKLQGPLVERAAGAGPEKIAENQALNARLYAIVKSAKTQAEIEAKARPLLAEAAAKAGLPSTALDAQAGAISSDWFRFFLTYDPLPALREVRCPVLALAGSKDLQVPAAENLPLLRQALAANPDATVEELPGLNHLFQIATTGGVGEYGASEQTLAPVVLETVTTWIEKRVGS